MPLLLALTVLGRYFPSIMIEGGASIITSALTLLTPSPSPSPSSPVPARPPISQVIITLAPLFIGGVRSVTRLLDPPFPRLHHVTCELQGGDLVLHALTAPEEERGVGTGKEASGTPGKVLRELWASLSEVLTGMVRRLRAVVEWLVRSVTVRRVLAVGGSSVLVSVGLLDALLLSHELPTSAGEWLLWALRYAHRRRSYLFALLLLLVYLRPYQTTHPPPPLHPTAPIPSTAPTHPPRSTPSPSPSLASSSFAFSPSTSVPSSTPYLLPVLSPASLVSRTPALKLSDLSIAPVMAPQPPPLASKASCVLAEIKSRRQSLQGGGGGGRRGGGTDRGSTAGSVSSGDGD